MMNIVDVLPNECWIHIFGYLKIDEVGRVVTRTSQSLAHQLLNTEENHNSIYRHLCEVQMKADLENAIESILERRIIDDDSSYYYNTNRRTGRVSVTRSNATSSGLSIKQMRENLKFCTIRARSLFPMWFSENSTLEERINQAIKRSFTTNVIYIPQINGYNQVTQEVIDQLKELREKEDEQVEKKATNFVLDIQKLVDKQKKHPKWKQIWNGHYNQNIFSITKKSISELVVNVATVPNYNRRRSGYIPPTCEEFKKTLTEIYNGLKSIPPEKRREIMFKTFKCPFKIYKYPNPPELKRSSLFSQIVTGVYKLSIRRQNLGESGIDIIYGKLIDFFIQESIAYNVKTPILVECFIPNNSPIHMLLRTKGFTNLALKVVKKYTRFLKNTSLNFRFYLLVKCFSDGVDTKIIHELFYNNTFDKDVLSHTFKNNRLTYYLLPCLMRNCYEKEKFYYFANVYNLFVNCFQGSISSSFSPQTPSTHMPQFLWTNSAKFKEFLEPSLNFTPHYGENEMFKFFLSTMHNHYNKFSDQKKIKMDSEEMPLNNYVHFEKPKYDDLNDFKRRR